MKRFITISVISSLLYACQSGPCDEYNNYFRNSVFITLLDSAGNKIKTDAEVKELFDSEVLEPDKSPYDGFPVFLNVNMKQSVFVFHYRKANADDTLIFGNYNPRAENEADPKSDCGYFLKIDKPQILYHTFRNVKVLEYKEKEQEMRINIIK